LDAKALSRQVRGRTVSHLNVDSDELAIHFTDESWLVISRTTQGVSVVFHEVRRGTSARRSADEPTPRQREYLEFIAKYMARYGVAPAEADIQQHFMVSAPSVHSMIKTLERRGFITRTRGLFGGTVPRSIRVLIDLG
jgi:hypothetical protein